DKAMIAGMSYDNWVRRYAGDRDVLGRTVLLNDRSYTVVGVLPQGFRMQWLSASLAGADDPGPRDFWVPVGSPEWEPAYGSSMWEAVGRLAAGVTLEQARTETSVILAGAWEWGKAHAILIPRVEDETRGIGSPLLLLFGATGVLLLIACGNVAALSLGEMHGRAHEVATRAAIGADRWRIVRQLLTESLVLGVAGSALGVVVAVVGTESLVAMAPPIPRIDMVRVDLTVLGFAAFLGTLSGVLFGVAPAVLTAREALGTTLRSGGRSGSRRRAGLGRWVLAGEVGLTVMLLVASGLLVRSLSALFDMGLGFDPQNVASIAVSPSVSRYEGRAALSTLMNEVLPALEGIPGVTAVSAANALPFPGNTAGWGVRLHPEDSTYHMSKGYQVAPDYLDFMGIPILEGREFFASDDADAPGVVVVGESLAKALWGDRSPVGEEMFYPRGTVTVVGVAGDARQVALQDEPPLTFYVPFAQHARRTISFVVRTAAPGVDVFPAMREALWRVDSELAITDSGYLESAIRHSAADERYRTFLMSVFAALATVLAVVGIMGVTAQHVAHRTREIGIRKALGAENPSLLGGVVGEAARTGAWGIGLGLLGAFWLGPVLASFLFGVESFDLPTYAGVAVLFMGVSVLASYLPARRILRVDPVTVLKEQ
ncbi:MAG: FtsX-like permease family protein, partial [Dehalococcoidia bacterium]